MSCKAFWLRTVKNGFSKIGYSFECKHLLNITCTTKKFHKCHRTILGSPIPALVYCLYAAYTSDNYEIRARARCGSLQPPPNFAISVSEATSVPNSSKNVWILGIVLHVYPRIFQGNLIFKKFSDNLQQQKNVFQYAWWYNWIYIDW